MSKRHLAHILIERAATLGDRTALLGRAEGPEPGPRVTWTQFAARSRAIGQALAACGVPEGGAVGFYSGNRTEWLLCDFGAHMARAIPVPLYPSSTASQAAFILGETGATVVFAGGQEQVDKALAARRPESPYLVVSLEPSADLRGAADACHLAEFEARGAGEPWAGELEARLSRASEEDLFTILYTSGTTGEPKGVMLTHGNMVAQLPPHEARLPAVGPDDVSLSFLPLSHIFERGWTYYALYRGMEVHIVEEPRKVMDALARSRPAVMCSVPRLMEKVYQGVLQRRDASARWKQRVFDWAVRTGADHGECRREGGAPALGLRLRHALAGRLVLNKIRDVFGGRLLFMPCAGAPLSADLHAFFWGAGVGVIHGYGLTETTATVCAHPMQGFRFGTVGPPLPGTEVRIAPDGEILVKGPGVSPGYFKRAAENRELFKDGWFRTGDQGMLDGEGHLTITDRLKDLIKTSGGKMVAPQALEAGVARDPLVDQVAVVGDLRHYITALIVPAFDALAEWARAHGVTYHSFEELIHKPEVVALYQEKVAAVNAHLARFEQIRKFRLIPHPFTIEGGEITPTLKVRRRNIVEKYRDLLDAMYAEDEPAIAT